MLVIGLTGLVQSHQGAGIAFATCARRRATLVHTRNRASYTLLNRLPIASVSMRSSSKEDDASVLLTVAAALPELSRVDELPEDLLDRRDAGDKAQWPRSTPPSPAFCDIRLS